MSADLFVIKPTAGVIQAEHVRTTLRSALRAGESVWGASPEHVRNATVLIYGDDLPAERPWLLTKSQLTTLVLALRWRREPCGTYDAHATTDAVAHHEIENAVAEAYWAAHRTEECEVL